MRSFLLCITLLFSNYFFAQANTEVYLFDLKATDTGYELSNKRNISNNEGYDNQPSFYNDNVVLFSSTRNGQTDIAAYNIRDNKTRWITNTPMGSEYSPMKIPNQRKVSSIRLDEDGKQLLYSYDLKTRKSTPIVNDLVVGYHTWFSEDMLVSSVLDEETLSLTVTHIDEPRSYKLQKKVGRSLHKIPNTKQVSYVSKETDAWEIKSIDPVSGATASIAPTLPKKEDHCWLIDGTLLMASDNVLLKFNPKTDKEWSVFRTFHDKNIVNISRLAVNATSSMLAIVAEVSPEEAVQKHVASFNQRRLDDLAHCFSEDVLVANFPADTLYTGREKLRDEYRKLYERNENASMQVAKRIVIGNKVIDEEMGQVNGVKDHRASFYEVNDGLIDSMVFLFANHPSENEDAEAIVQKQLDTYNARDIEGFLATYTDDIRLYDFPNELSTEGKEQMRVRYQRFFENTPDLHCEIKNRIVIGNKVIDEEFLTINGKHKSAVAVYEVENGLIAKVTFVRVR